MTPIAERGFTVDVPVSITRGDLVLDLVPGPSYLAELTVGITSRGSATAVTVYSDVTGCYEEVWSHEAHLGGGYTDVIIFYARICEATTVFATGPIGSGRPPLVG